MESRKKITHYNILLVEDEKYLLNSLERHINACELCFQITGKAGNGAEALALLEKEVYHLVITDIRMPVMDGLILTQKLHEQYPHIVALVISGFADFDYARTALKHGVFDYLLKPVNPEELENVLNRARLNLQNFYELAEDTPSLGKDAEQVIEYATLYIRENYMNEIDFSAVAHSLGFSASYLTKLFNRYAGETPLRYLTGIRIREAKRLLTDTALPIQQVGEKVGYPDQFYFSKTFRKITGSSPSSFRKTAVDNQIVV